MANPQIEDGYIRIANELFEAIYMHYDFTKRQLKVISTIIRNSYGWNRKECKMTIREIEEKTGMKYQHIYPVIKELISMNVIKISGESASCRTFKLNKNYTEWRLTKTVSEILTETVNPTNQNGYTDTNQNGEEILTETVRDTIKRQLKTVGKTAPPEFLRLWEMYPAEKRYGLEFMKPEEIQAVIDNEQRVKEALENYVRQTEPTYICKAEKFFREKWKAYAPTEEEKKKGGKYQ